MTRDRRGPRKRCPHVADDNTCKATAIPIVKKSNCNYTFVNEATCGIFPDDPGELITRVDQIAEKGKVW